MVGQAEIVVGAQVQHVLRVAVGADVDCRLLRPGDQAFGLEKPLRLQGLGLVSERFEKCSWHGGNLRCSKGRKV